MIIYISIHTRTLSISLELKFAAGDLTVTASSSGAYFMILESPEGLQISNCWSNLKLFDMHLGKIQGHQRH